MKTTIEINGFEIVISEQDGAVVVSAIKDEETVEEFTLEIEDAQGAQDGLDIQGAQEVQDFPQAQGQAQAQGDFMQSQDDESEIKLESFNSFIGKKR